MRSPFGESAAKYRVANGFTLIELLVVLTLLALLLPLAFGGFRQSAALWARLDGRSSGAEQVQGAGGFFTHQLSQIYPAFLPATAVLDFDGAPDSMQFIAPLPDALQAGGKGRYLIRVVLHDQRRDLVMNWSLDWTPATEAREVTLLEDIDRLEMRYWGRIRPNDEPIWREEWRGVRWLPELISVNVKFRAGDLRKWTEIVVAPQISADAGCAYDRLTFGCLGR